MRNCLIALMIVGGLLAVGTAPGASAAPVGGATAAVAFGTREPAIEQVYWWRGRWYPYYWGGRYYPRRNWRYGRWYYY